MRGGWGETVRQKENQPLGCGRFFVVAMAEPLPVVEWSSISEEDDLVDLCQQDAQLVNGVAQLLVQHVKRLQGIERPFTVLKKWLKETLHEEKCKWSTQSFEILAQWVTALSLFVPSFAPGPFKYSESEAEVQLPMVIRDSLFKQFKGVHPEPNPNANQHQHPNANQNQHANARMGQASLCACAKKNEGTFCNACGKRNEVVQQEQYPAISCKCGKVNPAASHFCCECAEPLARDLSKEHVQLELQRLHTLLEAKDTIIEQLQSGSHQHRGQHSHNLVHGTTLVGKQPMGAHETGLPEQRQHQSAYVPGKGEHGEKGEEKWFPSFSYDETRKIIVNNENPQYHLSHPAFWKPNEKLQLWRPEDSSQLHEMELTRLRLYQEMHGYLMAALSAGTICGWPENGVGKPTNWDRLDPVQKAVALLEAQISIIAGKAEGVKVKVVKRQLGMTHSAFSPEELKEMSKLQEQEAKTSKRLNKGADKDPYRDTSRSQGAGRATEHQGDKGGGRGQGKPKDLSKVMCYACGNKGHMAKNCAHASKKQENQKQSLLRAMEQLSTGALQPPEIK